MKSRRLSFHAKAAIIMIITIAAFILFMSQYIRKGNDIKITSSSVEITGLRGEKYNFKDISSISLEESIPKIQGRLLGSEIGAARRGTFTLEGLGTCKLFTVSESGPFIFMKAKDYPVILNLKDPDSTKQTFDEIKKYFNQ